MNIYGRGIILKTHEPPSFLKPLFVPQYKYSFTKFTEDKLNQWVM